VAFAYYDRLGPRGQAIYRQSDRVSEIRLPQPELLHPFVALLREALAREERRAVEEASRCLARGITEMLRVAPVELRVLAVRPHGGWGELHGLYTEADDGPARIQLWMRTAARRRVVAFRSFLRTLLHELGHHLDYRYLKLGDSYHTEGFFRRESSLVAQLLPEAAAKEPVKASSAPDAPSSTRRSDR
jgi:hypothetical protein